MNKIFEYFTSPDWECIPFVKILALLSASLARKAALNQKSIPDKGTYYDFNFISVLLPYCDAMFIDKKSHAYLNENPVKTEIQQYGTKIYSLNNKDEFINYLTQIEDSASEEHICKVKEVYGDII